ncbi:uracil-DNA glycosylase [Microbacterium luteum]|uniref:uracil-DNA glycosylase n=1 Tax=Microbacterium luteum TaxID=2782167 RepID=UPI001888D3DB|nr:uracil-DNA glycosylase [Microbacterium luteum]
MITQSDCSRLPDDWAVAVADNGFDLMQLYDVVDDIYATSSPGQVSPPTGRDVFRAFHLTPLDAVRAVIVGEDPYPIPDQAHGLAFSTPTSYTGSRPKSLGRIFGGLRRDVGIAPTQDDLTPWARRGILLLNVALTHGVGDTEPDLATWEQFTVEVLRAINSQPKRIAWLLWGGFANDVADLVPLNNPLHRRFANAHPRAGRADRPTLAKSPPFGKVSAFLGSKARVDWDL